MPTSFFQPVAGVPRSGSTLLQNILAQNPAHHVTPTNGLLSLVLGIRDTWSRNDAFRSQGLQAVKPRVSAAIRGLIRGFYENELAAGKTVFDKNRGWLAHVDLLEEVLERPVKVIVTVRDVKAVVASFEKLHRRNALGRRHYLGPAYIKAQTTHGRAQVLCSEGGVVGLPINFIRDARNRGLADRMVLVPYRMLTESPVLTMNYLHERLGLEPFDYDPGNVRQVTVEDDSIHGWGPGLHTIRPKIEPPTGRPWEGVLPPHTCQWAASRSMMVWEARNERQDRHARAR
jgi:sulfotransferase